MNNFKKVALGVVAAAALLVAPTSVSAGAGEWDLKYSGPLYSTGTGFSSGGGDVKVCLTSTTAAMNIKLAVSSGGTYYATTSGGSTNCAIYRSVGSAGTYKVYPSSTVDGKIYD